MAPPPPRSPQITDSHRIGPDRETLHHRLEVIEHRIQTGQDLKHAHPALAVSALHSHKSLTFTKSEAKMRRQYRIVEEPHTIPKFWTKRDWDSPADVMDVESSLNLKSQIRTVTRLPPPLKKSATSSPKTIPKKRIVRQKPPPKPETVREAEIRQRPPPAPRIETQERRGLDLSADLTARMEERVAFRLSLPADLYGTDASGDETDFDVF
jgi:hypothetical protein